MSCATAFIAKHKESYLKKKKKEERKIWEDWKVYYSPGGHFQATKDLVLLLLKLIAKSSIILIGSNPKSKCTSVKLPKPEYKCSKYKLWSIWSRLFFVCSWAPLTSFFCICKRKQRLKCKIQPIALLQNLSQLKVLNTEIRALITIIYKCTFFHSPVLFCERY